MNFFPGIGARQFVLTVMSRRGLCGVVAVLVLGLLSACASPPPAYFDPAKAHHQRDGFTNIHGLRGGKSLNAMMRWRWQAWQAGAPAVPLANVSGYEGFEVVKPNLALLAGNRTAPTVTWIGHATVLVQLGGLNILTDPHFTKRASPTGVIGPQRKVPLPVTLAELPRIDIVVISHNHPDSLDAGTVAMLREQSGGPPLFLVPLGVDKWLQQQGIQTTQAMDWWDRYEKRGVTAWFVPAQHWSARGLTDRNETLWGGWVLQANNYSIYFVGDSGYTRHFAEIGARFGGFDLALIPVGAYEPRWFMQDQHINPSEAVQVHLDVKSKRSIGVHWGTFELTDEPLDQPISDLAAARRKFNVPDEEFLLLKHGQTLELSQ